MTIHRELRDDFLVALFSDTESVRDPKIQMRINDFVAGLTTYGGGLFESIVVVQSKEQLLDIDSSKIYLMDGYIDMGTQQIDLSGGKSLDIFGFSLEKAGLFSTENNYDMIVGADAGNILLTGCKFTTSGTGSRVVGCTSATGNEAFELNRVNFYGCTSLGFLTNYRQILMNNVGLFGGTPELTLDGAMNGIKVDNYIVRGIGDGVYNLWTKGAGLTFSGRVNMICNVDLPALTTVGFTDFDGNFLITDSFQLNSSFITRNGVINDNDATILPNINEKSVYANFTNNEGLNNTFKSALNSVIAEIETDILLKDTYYLLNGTWSPDQLTHFDEPANGQLRYLSQKNARVAIRGQVVIEGSANTVIDLEIRILRYNGGAPVYEDAHSIRRVINNSQGQRDVAYYTFSDLIKIGYYDIIEVWVENVTDATNVTAELDSYIIVESL